MAERQADGAAHRHPGDHPGPRRARLAGEAGMNRTDRRQDPFDGSPNPIRLYRNPERGMIFGVCAGLAEYFGMRDWQIRAIVIMFLVVFPPHTGLVYLIAAFVDR